MDINIDKMVAAFRAGDLISTAIFIVGILILIVSLVALVISIYLAIRYAKYNKKKNSAGLTGEQAARQILDLYGLQKIKVTATGSIMFGNSYSHYFKKVRLRRRTWKKDSIASLAMASQKSSLAILDKEKDPDMRQRVRLIPITTLGPLAFVPLLVIGIVLDYIRIQQLGIISLICTIIGAVFYLFSFVLSLKVLKTEKKAQQRAVEILARQQLATPSEIRDMQKLFKLYNLEYINDMILSLLELIYNVLRIIEMVQSNSKN